MKIFVITNKISDNLVGLEKSSFYSFITKSQKSDLNIAKQAEEIIAKTKKEGDKALINLSNKFDKTNFKKAADFIVSENEIKLSEKAVSKEVKSALNNAFKRIKDYHQKQLPKDFSFKDNYLASGNLIAGSPRMHQLMYQLIEPHVTPALK